MSALRADTQALPPLRRALVVLWPAFVMAGVLEMLVFVVVDPGDFALFGGAPLGWSRPAVYTVTFFIFWGVMAVAGALTLLFADAAARASTSDAIDELLE